MWNLYSFLRKWLEWVFNYKSWKINCSNDNELVQMVLNDHQEWWMTKRKLDFYPFALSTLLDIWYFSWISTLTWAVGFSKYIWWNIAIVSFNSILQFKNNLAVSSQMTNVGLAATENGYKRIYHVDRPLEEHRFSAASKSLFTTQQRVY